MKIFLIFLILKCSLILHYALGSEVPQYKSEKDPNFFEQCKGVQCRGQRGFFNEKFSQIKYFYSSYPTTIVLHVKGVQNPNRQEYRSMHICQSSKCDLIKLTSRDQIFVYKNVNKVIFHNFNPGFPYHVNYYIGCKILEKQNTVVEHVNPFMTNDKCWIIIPRIYENSKKQYVASTFAMIKNVKVPKGASLNLYNMVSDRQIWKLTSDTTKDATMVESNQHQVLYNRNSLTTVMYFEVQNCHNCMGSSFNLELSGLSSHDYSCFKEKQACEHHIGANDTKYDCESSKHNRCSAFDQISYKLTGEKQDVQKDESEAVKVKKLNYIYKRSCQSLFKGKENLYFCGSKTSRCSRYRHCSLHCFLYRMTRGCRKSSSNFYSVMF